MTSNDDKYTDPELRTEIKEKVQASDKGGQPGQWSARKAQMMASEYKKEMHARGEEPYTTDKSEKDDRQKHLTTWTSEEWQTSDGNADAKNPDGTENRYLPKKAWESMSEEEKVATNEAKLEGSKAGQQFVANTDAAKSARKAASGEANGASIEVEEDEDARNDALSGTELETQGEDAESEPKGDASLLKKRGRSDEEDDDDNDSDSDSGKVADSKQEDDKPRATKKAKVDDEKANQAGDIGHDKPNEDAGDGEHGQQCSAARLPQEGQKVFWRAAPGWCEGTVLEILHSSKKVGSRTAKATKEDPRLVLKSAKSGKSAIHKPSAVYF